MQKCIMMPQEIILKPHIMRKKHKISFLLVIFYLSLSNLPATDSQRGNIEGLVKAKQNN